jgi:hypothetical protein
MGALLDYLTGSGIQAKQVMEPAENFLGDQVQEPVIQLEGQNLNKIYLMGSDAFGCNSPGDILRFQYIVSLPRSISNEEMKDMTAHTKLTRENRVEGSYGGKVTGITWEGQKLAGVLNTDREITDNLMKCAKIWSHLELQIEAYSPREICISGPRFSDPGAIADLYHSAETREDIQHCAFGFPVVDRIAGQIKNSAA